MALFIITIALCAFTLVSVFLSGIGKDIDNKERRIKSVIGRVQNEMDEELELPFMQRFLIPAFYAVLKGISRAFPQNKGNGTTKLEKDLKLAGIKLAPNEYTAARLMATSGFMLLGLIGSWFLPVAAVLKFLIVVFVLLACLLAPKYFLQLKINGRQEAIKLQLPDIMDLLSVSVEAGLGFDSALIKVSERAEGPLIDEFVQVHREIQMGRPRRDALKNLGDRSSVGELKTFAGAVIQAEQLGIPIKNVLRAQSQQLRLSRKQLAEEKAMKAPVKMMLPLVMFIFPVIFIVLLGPTIIQIIQKFGS